MNRRRGGVQRSKLQGIPNWGRLELEVQSGRKNQPACFQFLFNWLSLEFLWVWLKKTITSLLSVFGHIARMDDDTDAKMILTAPPPDNWKKPLGHPRVTWLNTIQRDLRAYNNLTLNKAVDLAQNRPLWRLISAYDTAHS